MKTGKPERPYYQQTVDETLSNIHSTLEGLAALRHQPDFSSTVRMRYRKKRANPPGCASWRILTTY
jgi:hypothetical protein